MITTLAFDFDGVIADSVNVKTEAFAHLFSAQPPEVVAQIVEHHLQHGGMSRFDKIRFYFANVLCQPLGDRELQLLCERFRELVFERVVSCPWIDGALEIIEACHARQMPLFIVSGTPEMELREIAARRGIAAYFTGIFGAPARKPELLAGIVRERRLRPDNLLYVGDALDDYQAAATVGVGFVARAAGPATTIWAGVGVPVLSDLRDLSKQLDDGPQLAVDRR